MVKSLALSLGGKIMGRGGGEEYLEGEVVMDPRW
jgi:hypothetical protein